MTLSVLMPFLPHIGIAAAILFAFIWFKRHVAKKADEAVERDRHESNKQTAEVLKKANKTVHKPKSTPKTIKKLKDGKF